MATVYLARDLKHDRQVALKVLRPDVSALLGRDRFLAEIRVTGRLDHPHILTLIDSGAVGDVLYCVLPLVRGESLRERLRRERNLPISDAVRLTQQIAGALEHAHQHGILHRDVKPENVLLHEGEAMLADFGVALAVEQAGENRLTETGLNVGTPQYMSPEQATGERALDARSDVYALGAVLYEMLVGEPPHTGRTRQAIMARALTERPTPLHVLRATVPPALDAAVLKALEPIPADRWASAAEFASALSPSITTAPEAVPVRAAPPPGQRRRLLWRVTWVSLAVLTAAAAVLGTLRWRHGSSRVRLEQQLVAVAPFEVLDPRLQVWHEGIVDLLSRYLDGAGPLRAVPPTTVINGWSGHADRLTAKALGLRTGAGIVVFGALVPKTRDSVLVRATVLQADGAAEEVEVVGAGDALGALIDSLGRRILYSLGRAQSIGAVQRTSLGATSLPALKAFLHGEQFYRQGHWDSALVQYDRAVRLDSTFALPYHRLALVLWWDPTPSDVFPEWWEYARRAARFSAQLAPRDSLLVTALARMTDLGLGAFEPVAFAQYRTADSLLGEVTRRYPTDPDGWYLWGELRFHVGAFLGITPEEQLFPFRRAIALDSGFGPAYEHTVGLALATDRQALARRYAAAAAALAAGDAHAARFRLDALLLDPRQARMPEAARLIATAAAVPLRGTMRDMDEWDDSAGTALVIARSFRSKGRDYTGAPEWIRDSTVQKRMLALRLAERGHLREAYAALPDRTAGGRENAFLSLALLGVVPAVTADADFRRLTVSESLLPIWPEVAPRQEQGLTWWLARGDTVALARFAYRADSLGSSHPPALAALYLHWFARAARAYHLLLRGDSAGALRRLEALPDSVCLLLNCRFHKMTQARLLVAAGRDREAADVLNQWLPSSGEPWFVVSVLEQGRVAERLGQKEQAIRSYRRVVNLWRQADPVLQPYVAEARRGLVRVTAR
jgi:serine/threonine-protein kinase